MNRAERIEKDGLKEEPLEFYYPNKKYGFFSNFSDHPVILPSPYGGLVSYDTGEHRYQAMKAANREDYLKVFNAASPSLAQDYGRRVELVENWGNSHGDVCWFVMCELVLAKAMQYPSIKKALLADEIHNKAIWEDSPTDDIWGIRYANDYSGKNLLGKAWMNARGILLAAK